MKSNPHPPPSILLLNGFPGVGKLTIAKCLLKSLDKIPGVKGRLIDNHQVIDHVIQVLKIKKHSPAYYAARKSVVRSEFFDDIVPEVGTVIVMTSVFAEESEEAVDQWVDHLALAREKGMGLYQVNINCSGAVNEERWLIYFSQVVTEERRTSTKGKNTRVGRLRELRQMQSMINPLTPRRRKDIEEAGVEVRFLELDNSMLSAGECAERILRDFLEWR